MGLVAVVAVAVAGGATSRQASVFPSASHADVSPRAPVVSVAPSGEAMSSLIFLDAPATSDQVVTTATVAVRGDLRLGVARLEILVRSTSAGPVAIQAIDSLSVDWRRDPRRIPFVATLSLPHPRPSGPAVIQVVAYDRSGRERGVFTRRIQIGALIDPTYGNGAMRPPTGEDGLMGGITSGTNFAWLSDGR
ncbi:MAG TPA: hypothetical protein VM408_02240 [Methylomirabilota bacterium]|nr:hypothetical protein [Methylomirabilota bacterium]